MSLNCYKFWFHHNLLTIITLLVTWSNFVWINHNITHDFDNLITRSKVDDNITEKDGVWDDVEDDAAEREIVIEEGDGHGEDDEVGDQEEQHADVPVEPEIIVIGTFISEIIVIIIEWTF